MLIKEAPQGRKLLKNGGIRMSHVSEKVRPYFENLSIDLKNEILKRDVEINTLLDLIKCLEAIVDEG